MRPDILIRHHSAEHLLTAVMRRDFGSERNLEMHLGRKKSKCDYRVDRPLNEGDRRAIEAAVNAEIGADHPVNVMHITRTEADGRFDLWKVPSDAEAIRVVGIGGFDETPCSGEHVERTGQIGRFFIRSMDMKDDETVRIRYGIEESAS